MTVSSTPGKASLRINTFFCCSVTGRGGLGGGGSSDAGGGGRMRRRLYGQDARLLDIVVVHLERPGCGR